MVLVRQGGEPGVKGSNRAADALCAEPDRVNKHDDVGVKLAQFADEARAEKVKPEATVHAEQGDACAHARRASRVSVVAYPAGFDRPEPLRCSPLVETTSAPAYDVCRACPVSPTRGTRTESWTERTHQRRRRSEHERLVAL